MITISIKHGDIENSYTEEIETFAWDARNNEATGFSASVPNLTATVTLGIADSFLSKVCAGDLLQITSDIDDGLVLPLYVLEATTLYRKGKTEISCAGNFFEQTNNIFGTLTLAADDWATTQEKYGLEKVEMHEPNRGVIINVDKKEDIALGVAWGFDTRRNISLTPFSTADGTFADDGIGIFENTKNPLPEQYAPLYKIKAEDIVSYEVEAASPPVTHIQTTSLGDLGPTPQIPTIAVPKYSGALGSQDIDDNVKAYFIEETGLAAIYTAMENQEGEVVSQSLTWTDGFTNIWTTGERKRIIGIFENRYALITGTSEVSIVNRETELVENTFNVDTTALYQSPTNDPVAVLRPFKTNKLFATPEFPNMAELEILWFRQATTSEQPQIGIVYSEAYTGGGMILTAESEPGDMLFAESCKIRSTASDLAYGVKALFWVPSTSPKCIVVSIFQGEQQGDLRTQQYSRFLSTQNLVQPGQSVVSIKPLDIIACEPDPTPETPDYTLWGAVLQQGNETLTLSVAYEVDDITHDIKVYWAYPGTASAKWLLEGTEIGVKYGDAPLLLTAPNGAWALITIVVYPLQLGITILQQGNMLDWAGEDTLLYYLGHGTFIGMIYKGSAYWDVFLQTGVMPLLSRKRGEATLSQKIAEGNTNTLLLDFKVGALQQKDKLTWDSAAGRITVELTKFFVKNNVTGEWIEKDIQAINILATTSYVQIYLTPDDQEDDVVTLVKVLGYSLSYNGLVRASLTGIIVAQ